MLKLTVRILAIIILLWMCAHTTLAAPHPNKPYPTNDNPATHIRFHDANGADAKRQQLVNYIWPNGLPTTTLPGVTANIGLNDDLHDIVPSYVSRVDKLNAKINDLDNFAYLLTPKNTANLNRLVVVHMGHASSGGATGDALGYGLGNTVNALLQAGYSVATLQMPLCGWNYDTTAVVNGTTVTIPNRGSFGHNDMFTTYLSALGGAGNVFRFFLEPTIQVINHFKNMNPNMRDVTMMGLSGGGWTTTMVAAIDPRVKLSIPVAGSAPLYVQNIIGSTADWEQIYPAIFGEGTPGQGPDGIATHLENYVLGGYGKGRSQIMVINQFEPVGLFPTTWVTDTLRGESVAGLVTSTLNQIGEGSWSSVYDISQSEHIISPWTINNVILPAMAATNTPEPSSFVLLVPVIVTAAFFKWRCRKGK